MKMWKVSLMIVSIIALCIVGCIFYAFKIEPYRLEVNEYELSEDQPLHLKVVQFSDLHIKADFTSTNVEKVVDTINEQNADIVVFTGDLYDNYAKYNDDTNVIEQLHRIKAKYGKIAIWGNRDYGGGAVRQYEHIMSRSGFTLLQNESHVITVGNDKKVLVSGVDDLLLGNPSLPDQANATDSVYSLLLTHESDGATSFADANCDLILSGHSHGGQIKIPFIPSINKKALSNTALSSQYSSGLYSLNEKQSTLYVNTGIGTTHVSARFGVIPEIAVFNL